tara:strand:+ start:377 stop:508 length:132 start_codon:yes stop_codon:yes gene_type:complete
VETVVEELIVMDMVDHNLDTAQQQTLVVAELAVVVVMVLVVLV